MQIAHFSAFPLAFQNPDHNQTSTGSPVDHYVVQHSADGRNWVTVDDTVTQLSYILSAEYGVSHQIRVAGVDAQNRQGPFSLPSDPYTPDAGAPGQPGQPIIF